MAAIIRVRNADGTIVEIPALKGDPGDKSAVLYTEQSLTEEQKTQARENIGAVSHKDINGQNKYAKYFTITADGVLSLKPEYRGACYGAIEFVPGMDVTNGYFYVDKLGPGSILYQCVRTSNSSAVNAEGYPKSLEQTYYFTPASNYENKVSDNGAGMVGSKNYELPELLYVPEMVGSIKSIALESMIFDHNQAFKEIVLPITVTSIPEQCFFGCQRLVDVYNTDRITSIGKLSFSRCVSLKQISLPSLEYAEEQAFRSCVLLEYAHIGKVTELSDDLFRGCYELKKIEHDSSCKVARVGKGACTATYKLREADFIKDVTFMDIGAFFKSGINYDWSSLDNCAFAQEVVSGSYRYPAYPTSLQLNPVDFWSDCTPSACHNPTPTHFCQLDPRWINRWVGNIEESGKAYGNGCGLFTLMHAYCGLNNLELSNVAEFESIVNRLLDNDPSIWTDYLTLVSAGDGIKEWGERLGLSVTEYYEYNTSTLQKLYDALLDGSYAYAVIPTYTTRRGTLEVNPGGHAALIYGATEDGRLMVIDSNELYPENMTVGNKYSALYQSSFYPDSQGTQKPIFCIISKPIEYIRYATIDDALAETNEVADGAVGAYYDKYRKYHITLLGDMESATRIDVQRNCTLHLNGYTLTFTSYDAYLNISTAKEVVIDGTGVRKDQSSGTVVLHKSAIKKDGTTSTSGSQQLIKTTGTNLIVYGGEYSATNITNPDRKSISAIVAGTSTPVAKIKLNDCVITATALEKAHAYGVQVDSLMANNCTITATSENANAVPVLLYVDGNIKNCTVVAEATGDGTAYSLNLHKNGVDCTILNTTVRGTVNGYNADNNNNVVGLAINTGWKATVTDCDIAVNRIGVNESDYTASPLTTAITCEGTGSVTCNGTNIFVPAYP
jgi:hypothetical protein